MPDSDLNILAVDTAINAEGHSPGIAQPVSLDEIKDIYMSDLSKSERVTKLNELRNEFVSRQSADVEAGFGPLIEEIERGLAYLNKDAEGFVSSNTLKRSA